MALKFLPQAEKALSGTLTAFLDDTATEAIVGTPPSSAKLPTYFTFEPDSDNEETVRVIDVSGNTITIERGVYNGGVGVEHQANSTYKQRFTSEHWQKVVEALDSGYLTEEDSLVVVRNSTTEFQINSIDRSAYYAQGRRLRINGGTYCTVESVTYSGGNTTVTVSGDSLPVTITSIELSIDSIGTILFQKLWIDAISERTPGSGVTVDGLLIKDSIIPKSGIPELKAVAQATPDMTVAVATGKVLVGQTFVNYAGGNSSTVTAPTSNPRIDVLTIDSSGTLNWTTGSEAASPVIPTIPTNQIPICAIYNRVAETSIKNTDDSTNGYILHDLRSILNDLVGAAKRRFLVPANALFAATTNGAASGTIETTTNKVNLKVLDFDQTTKEYAHLEFPSPKYWNAGTIKLQFIWTAASGTGGVRWGGEAYAFSDDDALDQAYGTAQEVTDTLLATDDNHITSETSAMTVGGTPVAGDLINLRIYRDPAHTDDTLNADARLIAIIIIFDINKYDDQ